MGAQSYASRAKSKWVSRSFKTTRHFKVCDHTFRWCGACDTVLEEPAAVVWICSVFCKFEDFEAYFDLYRGSTNTNMNAVAKLSFAGVFLFSSSVSNDFYFLNLDAASIAPLQQYSQLLKICWMFRTSWRPFDSHGLFGITFIPFLKEL